ncbi:MAG: hypothetical protein GX443_02175 [Deltaproteobacteria bacterium]|nr:hypothetical protein [Deltaproteobacteria bacterium]
MRPSGREVTVEFQRRRKRLLHNFGFALALFTLGLIFMQMADLFPGLLGVGGRGWKTAAFAQLLAGLVLAVTGFLQYRCPVCNSLLRGHDSYFFGVMLNPGKCPECGTRLQE